MANSVFVFYKNKYCALCLYLLETKILRMFIVRVRDLSAQLNKWYAFCFGWTEFIAHAFRILSEWFALIQT